jgi:hypothetical protein
VCRTSMSEVDCPTALLDRAGADNETTKSKTSERDFL